MRPLSDDIIYLERINMYVYIRNNQGFYDVGFFHPTNGQWFSESEWPSSNEASNRIHWLNGGQYKTG